MQKLLSVVFLASLMSLQAVAEVEVEDVNGISFENNLSSETEAGNGNIPVGFGLSLSKDKVVSSPISADIKYTILNSVVTDINHKTDCGYELSNLKYSIVYSYDYSKLKTIGTDPESIQQLASNTIESTIINHISKYGVIFESKGYIVDLHAVLISNLQKSLSNFVEEIEEPVLIQKIVASEYDETGTCGLN